jgi:hypothetical protein
VGTLLEQSDVGTDLPNFEMSHDCRLMNLQPRPFGVWITPQVYMAIFTHRLNLKMRINAQRVRGNGPHPANLGVGA